MSQEQRDRASAGLALFVVLSFLGSWFVAAALRVVGLTVAPAALGTRLFTTTLLYALTMGVQPVVATWIVRRWVDPPDHLDLALRPSRWVFSIAGAAGAVALALSAAALASLSGLGAGNADVELAPAPSASGLFVLVMAFLATTTLVWLQAFAEEVGWRGYFLPRAMERFGRWEGLILHGTVWGLWYAPVLFFASYGQGEPFSSVGRSLGFVVTCALLGMLFGWLRLASKSIVPVVLANMTLTLAAGLPYVVHGIDTGARSAAFGPPGWIVSLLLIAGLSLSKWRTFVQIPARAALPASPSALIVRVWVELERRPPSDRLH
ncbi:MAG: CPBP family intramembrane metalloprotease [Polyangiaceae bacterium]|nr:CPBP family intramembrane metalloprotease [Polyangiaceae bacterium]